MATIAPSLQLTAVYEPVEGGWTQARIEELPEVITAGPSLEDAKSLLGDALREYLLSLAQDAQALPLSEHAVRQQFALELAGLERDPK